MKKILFLVFSFPVFLSAQQKPVYQNLVFEGGGIRGIAYTGAIKALEENGVLASIQRTAGSSVGAVSALLISLGYTSAEIDSVLHSLSIETFNDGRWIFVGGFARMSKNYGWYRGNKFENWIRHIIFTKTGHTDITFSELHDLTLRNKNFKDFFCTGTNLSLQRAEVFGYTTSPRMKISTAVRISVSIPLYFGAVMLDEQGTVVKKNRHNNYSVYVDGGLLANYPLSLFDSCRYTASPFYCDSLVCNAQTLGIKLERPEQIAYPDSGNHYLAGYRINNMKTYISALYNILFETVNHQNKTAEEASRTVYISTSDISPKIRKIKSSDKKTLVENGYKGVNDFFKKG